MGKEIKKTKSGTSYFEVNLEEMIFKLNGLGICDTCCKPIEGMGFLIPVLNYVKCKECFNESPIQCNYYEEDRAYEDMRIKEYKKEFLWLY